MTRQQVPVPKNAQPSAAQSLGPTTTGSYRPRSSRRPQSQVQLQVQIPGQEEAPATEQRRVYLSEEPCGTIPFM